MRIGPVHLTACLMALISVAGAQTSTPPEKVSQTKTTTQTQETSPMVLIKTSQGDIKVELFADKAPITVKNFLQYVDDKFYNGTIFHRVMNGFMIQGGGFTKDFQQKTPRASIKNEAANGLKNDRGTLAMARTSDPDSASCQFFVNVVNNAGLNRPSPDGAGYCVFGKVVDGMDVVDKIKVVPTGTRGYFENVPTQTIEIIEVTRVK